MPSWRPLAVIVGGTAVVGLLMVLTDMGPSLPLIAGLGLFLGSAIWFTVALEGEVEEGGTVRQRRRPTPLVRGDYRVTSLRTGLAFNGRQNRTAPDLYISLVTVIDDELAASHGVDRATDPETAAAIIGADLAWFVADPDAARAIARPRDLDHILTLIERI